MEERNLTCIVCPIGCRLNITLEGDKISNISGNRCKRGSTYAQEECIAPKRMLTTTVRVIDGFHPFVPVKSDKAIPKELLLQCMNVIRTFKTEAPINMGDVLIQDICGTGVNIVAARSIPLNEKQEVS